MLPSIYTWVLSRYRRDEGATAVEYGIMVAAIAVAILIVVFALGDQIAALFQQVLDKITPAAG